jgi:hypothetical protein
MIKQIFLILLSSISVLLCSCCYVKCDCLGAMDASIGLIFNMDSTNSSGFKRSEIENAIFIKYNKSGQAIDTSSLRNYGNNSEYYFTIKNYMDSQSKTYQESCTYKVINETGNVDLLISDIDFKGEYSGRCCNCYDHKSISFKVNGVQQYFEGNDKLWARYAINKQ